MNIEKILKEIDYKRLLKDYENGHSPVILVYSDREEYFLDERRVKVRGNPIAFIHIHSIGGPSMFDIEFAREHNIKYIVIGSLNPGLYLLLDVYEVGDGSIKNVERFIFTNKVNTFEQYEVDKSRNMYKM